MSEAGCPGVADPGAQIAAEAHKLGIRVVPLVGPSSILLALMASGMDGQHFRFCGYLPIKEPARTNAIKDLERKSASSEGETQLFIETPYRNSGMLADLVKNCAYDAYSRGHRHLRAGRAHSHVLRSGLEKTGFVAAEAPDGLRNSRR